MHVTHLDDQIIANRGDQPPLGVANHRIGHRNPKAQRL